MINIKVLNHRFFSLRKKVPIYLKHLKYQTSHTAVWREIEERREEKERKRKGREEEEEEEEFRYSLGFVKVLCSMNNALIAYTESLQD